VVGRLVTARISPKTMMGPLGIAQASGDAARGGAGSLLFLVAVISLQVGILNLFPLAPLDGGHLAILAVEGVARRDLSPTIKGWIMNAGAAVIFLLIGVVLYSDISKMAFVQRLLLDGLGVRFLLVGDDFRFGRERAGDYALLRTMGEEAARDGAGFAVENLHTIMHGEERISSTRVREALARGDLEQTRHLLGRPYRIAGRVAHGDRRGRAIGFPTANIDLHRRHSPLLGVYAVLVHGLGPQPRPAVANIGTRPTVAGQGHRLEVHLFDFDQQIYGRHLEIEFRLRLRDERRFESFEALRRQIQLDAAAARTHLESLGFIPVDESVERLDAPGT